MKKIYVPKPGTGGSKESGGQRVSLSPDDYLDDILDDPDDDFICSQVFDFPDDKLSETQQSQSPVSPEPVFKRPQPPPPLQQSPSFRSGGQHNLQTSGPTTPIGPTPIDNNSDSKYDQLVGEILILKKRLETAKQQLEEEREAKQKLWDEKESTVTQLKEEYDKKLNNIQAKFDLKEFNCSELKMKINELERQLKTIKSQLDTQVSSKPLPYSLPIVMHRTLDFSTNKGFVDWDENVTIDDVPD